MYGIIFGEPVENQLVVFLGWVAHSDSQQEPVQLGLGQREGALQLDGVLGGHYQERLWQSLGLALRRHLAFLHGLQHRRLGAGSGPVDLVGQHHLGENGAGSELKLAGLLVVYVGAGDIGGEQVGGALYAPEGAAQGARHGTGQHGLADARHVLDQHVALAQRGYQEQLCHLPFADDDPPDVFVQPVGGGSDGLCVGFYHGWTPL